MGPCGGAGGSPGACRAAPGSPSPRGSLVVVVGYVGAREAWRLQSPLSTGAYPEMDGPALAALAERYWADHGDGPIPYIVSYDGKVGFQAAGSIVFDLPYRVRALDGRRRRATRRGSTSPISGGAARWWSPASRT